MIVHLKTEREHALKIFITWLKALFHKFYFTMKLGKYGMIDVFYSKTKSFNWN